MGPGLNTRLFCAYLLEPKTPPCDGVNPSFNSYLISFCDLLDHRRKAESGIELDPACLPIEVVVHCCCEVCGFLPSMNTASAGSMSPVMTQVVLSCDRGHRIPRPLRQLGTETTPSGEQSYSDVAIHGQDVTALSVPR